MSEDIKKDKIVGMGDLPLNVDYNALKKGLESGGNKSPFTNFFDSLKPQEPANNTSQEKPNHQD